jgi:hypothetical protein
MRRRVALIAVAALIVAKPVRADTIRLDQGFIALDESELIYSIGNAHFGAITLPPLRSWIGTGLDQGCASTGGCAGGERLTFTTHTDGTVPLGFGNAFFDGVAYTGVQFTGVWQFSSLGALTPTDGREFWAAAAPFQFVGRLTATGTSINHEQLFTADLFGTGTARLNLALSGSRYVPDEAASLSFKFESAAASPTPEPGSFVLLGTAIAGLIARRRKFPARAAQARVAFSMIALVE